MPKPILFKAILERYRDERKYTAPFIVDMDELCPLEAYTIYSDIQQAERYYLQQETTQRLIQVVQSGKMLTPLSCARFDASTYPFRNPSALREFIPKYKYAIEDGHHRYFAYKFCGIERVPIQVLITEPAMAMA